MTTKNVAMSTTLNEINQMMIKNLKDVNQEIKNIILAKLPKDHHSDVHQSFDQSKRLRALNSVKTIAGITSVLKNDLVWIPPVLHCTKWGWQRYWGSYWGRRLFFYVPIVETLKSLLNDDSFHKSSRFGNDVFIVTF